MNNKDPNKVKNKKINNQKLQLTCTLHRDRYSLGSTVNIQITVFRMGKQTLASRDTELRPQRGHNVHLTLVIDQKYLLSAAFDPAHRIPVHRPVARARLWRVLAPHQTIGAVLHSVEATVTVVVHITVKQVSVVAVLLCHAELCHASFPVAAVLRLALIV